MTLIKTSLKRLKLREAMHSAGRWCLGEYVLHKGRLQEGGSWLGRPLDSAGPLSMASWLAGQVAGWLKDFIVKFRVELSSIPLQASPGFEVCKKMFQKVRNNFQKLKSGKHVG